MELASRRTLIINIDIDIRWKYSRTAICKVIGLKKLSSVSFTRIPWYMYAQGTHKMKRPQESSKQTIFNGCFQRKLYGGAAGGADGGLISSAECTQDMRKLDVTHLARREGGRGGGG